MDQGRSLCIWNMAFSRTRYSGRVQYEELSVATVIKPWLIVGVSQKYLKPFNDVDCQSGRVTHSLSLTVTHSLCLGQRTKR